MVAVELAARVVDLAAPFTGTLRLCRHARHRPLPPQPAADQRGTCNKQVTAGSLRLQIDLLGNRAVACCFGIEELCRFGQRQGRRRDLGLRGPLCPQRRVLQRLADGGKQAQHHVLGGTWAPCSRSRSCTKSTSATALRWPTARSSTTPSADRLVGRTLEQVDAVSRCGPHFLRCHGTADTAEVFNNHLLAKQVDSPKVQSSRHCFDDCCECDFLTVQGLP